MNDIAPAPDCEILIVGAGPTGLTLANLLARRGIHAIVIDSKNGPVEEPRAVSIDDEALRVLQLARAHTHVARHMVPNTGFRMMAPSGRCIASIAPTRAELGFPKRNNVHQPRFEADLLESLQGCACVEVRFGTALKTLVCADDRVTARVENASGVQMSISGKYLAACDGGRSAVRRLLNVDMPGITAPQRWLVVDIRAEASTRESLVFADARRPRVFIPGPLGHQRWEFMVLPSEDPEQIVDLENVRRLLRAHGVMDPDICSVRVYTFHGRCAKDWQIGRVFLLGDAAHLNPPFGGQGMINGIRDASNLAWKLAYVLRGAAAPALLQTYQVERVPAMYDSIRLAMTLARIMMPSTRLRGWLQNLGVGLLYRLPFTRAYVAEMRFRPRSRMRAGFIVPAVDSSATVIGLMCAQPSVLRQGSQQRPFDEILGTGFALLALGRSAAELIGKLPPDWLARVKPSILVLDEQGAEQANADYERIELNECSRTYFQSSWGHVLLVRPDRYVMAEFSERNHAELAPRVFALFDEFSVSRIETVAPQASHEEASSAAWS